MISANMFRLLFSGRIHPAGWPTLRWCAFLTVVLMMIRPWSFLWTLPITLFFLLFFRDPDRVLPSLKDVVVSSADGTVVQVRFIVPPEELEMGDQVCLHIGIFMAPWNVHVNRLPYDGTIVRKIYRKGQFSHVAREESVATNERLGLVLETDKGPMACVQVAGFLARRIVCEVKEGDKSQRGEKYGIICFGSHMDLYLPAQAQVCTSIGQVVRGGETILASFPEMPAIISS